ncbi:MAG: hypothetical protein ACD_79C00698G0002 [uncultured bacterium]|nr:MAG: hypothetical protein ACD_79C00698G0002 [uncultured bacterium]
MLFAIIFLSISSMAFFMSAIFLFESFISRLLVLSSTTIMACGLTLDKAEAISLALAFLIGITVKVLLS